MIKPKGVNPAPGQDVLMPSGRRAIVSHVYAGVVTLAYQNSREDVAVTKEFFKNWL